MTRRWAPQTRYTLRRKYAEYNERFDFGGQTGQHMLIKVYGR